jgi:predicted DNA-binding protein (MmcQ/YjbR family)
MLEEKCDWQELADLVRDSYRMIAPKKLIALLNED